MNRPPRLVMWRHRYPRAVVRSVIFDFQNFGVRAGWRTLRRAGWLMFVVPFARQR